jgi:hypothetical protein
VVYPKITILAENPVSVVDKVVDRKGTRKQAEAYLKYLWSDEGQQIAAKFHLRPRSDKVLAQYKSAFLPVTTFTVDEVFGSWRKAQKAHFKDGGIYDQITLSGRRSKPLRRLLSELSCCPKPCKRHTVLPGFDLALGLTLTYLCLIVLIPLSATFLRSTELTWDQFIDAVVTSPRVLASYRLTFGASLLAAIINAVFGLLVAWVLVRYDFFGRLIVDALVDLPFALPTAVAGIALTACIRPMAGSASGCPHQGERSRRWACGWRWCSSACRSWCAPCSRCWKTWRPSWKKPRRRWVPAAGRPSAR